MAPSKTKKKASTNACSGKPAGGGVIGGIVPPKKKVEDFPLMMYLSKNCTFDGTSEDSCLEDESTLKAANDKRFEELLKAAKSSSAEKEASSSSDESDRKKALELLHSLEHARNQEDTWKVTQPALKKEPNYGGFLHPLKRCDKEEEYFSGIRKVKQPRDRKRSRSEEVVMLDDGKLLPKHGSNHVPIEVTLPPRSTVPIPRVPSVGLPFIPGPPSSSFNSKWMERSGSSLFSNVRSDTVVAYGVTGDEEKALAFAIAESLRTAKEEQVRAVTFNSHKWDNPSPSLADSDAADEPFTRGTPDSRGIMWDDAPPRDAPVESPEAHRNTRIDQDLDQTHNKDELNKMLNQRTKYSDRQEPVNENPPLLTSRKADPHKVGVNEHDQRDLIADQHKFRNNMPKINSEQPDIVVRGQSLLSSSSSSSCDALMPFRKHVYSESFTDSLQNLEASDETNETSEIVSNLKKKDWDDIQSSKQTLINESVHESLKDVPSLSVSPVLKDLRYKSWSGNASVDFHSTSPVANLNESGASSKLSSSQDSCLSSAKGSSKMFAELTSSNQEEGLSEPCEPPHSQLGIKGKLSRLPTSMPSLVAAMKNFSDSASSSEANARKMYPVTSEFKTQDMPVIQQNSPGKKTDNFDKHSKNSLVLEDKNLQSDQVSVPIAGRASKSVNPGQSDSRNVSDPPVEVSAMSLAMPYQQLHPVLPTAVGVPNPDSLLEPSLNTQPHMDPCRRSDVLPGMAAMAAAQMQIYQMLSMQQALGFLPQTLPQNFGGMNTHPSQNRAEESMRREVSAPQVASFGFPNPSSGGETGILSTGPGMGKAIPVSIPGVTSNFAGNLSGMPNNLPGNLSGMPNNLPGNLSGMPNNLPGNLSGMPNNLPGNLSGMPNNLAGNLSGMPNNLPGNLSGMPNNLPGNLSGMPNNLPGNLSGMPNNYPGNLSGMPNDYPGNLNGSPNNLSGNLSGMPNYLPGNLGEMLNNLMGSIPQGSLSSPYNVPVGYPGLPNEMPPSTAGLGSPPSNPSIAANFLQGGLAGFPNSLTGGFPGFANSLLCNVSGLPNTFPNYVPSSENVPLSGVSGILNPMTQLHLGYPSETQLSASKSLDLTSYGIPNISGNPLVGNLTALSPTKPGRIDYKSFGDVAQTVYQQSHISVTHPLPQPGNTAVFASKGRGRLIRSSVTQ